MAALDFEVVRFSQARATRQTPGIPDNLFVSPFHRAAVWWEAKTEIGRQRGGQEAFQRLCESVGWDYVLGTDDALHEWAIRRGLVERLGPVGLRVLGRGAGSAGAA